MADLRTLLAAVFVGIAHNQDDGTWVADRCIEVVTAHPDAVLRAIGGEAIVRWLESQDGYGFVVEALKNGSH